MRFWRRATVTLLASVHLFAASAANADARCVWKPEEEAPSPACAREFERACQAKKSYLTKEYRNRTGLDESLKRAISSKRRIIVIGESHGERSEKFFRWVFEDLKKNAPQFNCVMVEQPKAQYQTILDACNAGGTCNKKKLPEFSGVKPALELGYKVLAVDAVPDFMSSAFLDDVAKRNVHMANETAGALKSGVCESAVLIIGANHGHNDHGFASVPELLDKKGFKQYRMQLISPGFTKFGRLDPSWIWQTPKGESLCSEIPGLLGENFAIKKASGSGKVPAYLGSYSNPGTDEKEFSGTWADYHESIILGCADPLEKTCDVYRAEEWSLTQPTYLPSR